MIGYAGDLVRSEAQVRKSHETLLRNLCEMTQAHREFVGQELRRTISDINDSKDEGRVVNWGHSVLRLCSISILGKAKDEIRFDQLGAGPQQLRLPPGVEGPYGPKMQKISQRVGRCDTLEALYAELEQLVRGLETQNMQDLPGHYWQGRGADDN